MNKTKIIYYLFLLSLSTLFVLIFCSVSSPLTLYYTGDSSIFMTMGRLFLDGKVPYIDFFDHKGPVIILIEALGQMIAPYRMGLFILEILNLFFVLIFIDKTISFLLKGRMKLVVQILLLIILSATISSGNSTEEYSLLPLFIALYITCRSYFKSHSITISDAFIIGICFSFLFWLRLNNAGAICGMVLFLFLYSISKRTYRSLRNLLLFFIIAQIPLTTIFITYFYYHNGLYDLMYATFIFNFKYVQPAQLGKHFWISILAIILVVIGTILNYRKNKDKNIFLLCFSILVFNILTSNMGYVFKHYLILLMPSFTLGLMLVLDCISNTKTKSYIFYISIVFAIAIFTLKGVNVIKKAPENRQKYTTYQNSAKEILENISPKDMEKVYYYLVESHFYPIVGLNPNYKYFILQEWHGSHDTNIYREINSMMHDTPPMWIVMEKNIKHDWDNNQANNKEFRKILNNEFILFSENDHFILYKYNE
jgi:hypothetical protein